MCGGLVAHLAVVFPKGHVEHPMTAIFNTPMPAHQCGKAFDVILEAAQEVVLFYPRRSGVTALHFTAHFAQGLQPRPLPAFSKALHIPQQLVFAALTTFVGEFQCFHHECSC